MSVTFIKDYICQKLHHDAEYISGGVTYVLSMISLNIHLSSYGSTILVRFLSGVMSLFFTLVAVAATHFFKKWLDKNYGAGSTKN